MANIRELFAGARAPPRTGETPRAAPRAGDEVDDSVEKDGHREDVDDDARARSSATSTANVSFHDDARQGARSTAPTTYGRRKRAKSLNAASARAAEPAAKAAPSATRAYLDSIGTGDGTKSKGTRASASTVTKATAKTGEVVKKKRTQMCLDLGQSTMRPRDVPQVWIGVRQGRTRRREDARTVSRQGFSQRRRIWRDHAQTR